MRFFGLIILTCLLAAAVVSQDTVPTPPSGNNPEAVEPAEITDKEAFAAAIAVDDPLERANLLKIFTKDYADSDLKTKALESLTSVRAIIADTKLRKGESEEAIELFKLAVSEAPQPYSDDLFSKVLVNIPTNLFLLGKRSAAFEIADMLEARSSADSRQLLRLATFHISIKYATGARQLIEKAIKLNPDDPIAYQTLGTTNRIGFDLAGAANAYQKGLELQPDSVQLKQNLGDMKRALGLPAEAETLYREILAVDAGNVGAKTGLILSLFDQNKRKAAEDILIPELSSNPTNGFAMIGAAYWYVANNEPELALDYANQAIILEKSAIWGYLVLARAYNKLDRPLEAERMLIAASQYGSSAALSYELALAQSRTGFYFDAAKELKSKFFVENGKIVTELDGRIGAEADSFSELVALERKSVLFAPYGSYSKEESERLKKLFMFETAIASENVSDEELTARTTGFIGEEDDQTAFRRLYASKRLLDNNKLPKRASEIAQAAVIGVDKSAASEYSSSAVMADQLADGKRLAAEAGRTVTIPKISEATLAKIMRGRIEELTGRSLILTEDYPEAEVRFRRAVSVLPVNSAWWRSSMWRLGETYQKTDQDKKALESFVESYKEGPTAEKRAVIEGVYAKLNGNLDGIEQMLAKESKAPSSSSMFLKVDAESKNEVKALNTADPEIEGKVANPNPTAVPRITEDVNFSTIITPPSTSLKPVLPTLVKSPEPADSTKLTEEGSGFSESAPSGVEKLGKPVVIVGLPPSPKESTDTDAAMTASVIPNVKTDDALISSRISNAELIPNPLPIVGQTNKPAEDPVTSKENVPDQTEPPLSANISTIETVVENKAAENKTESVPDQTEAALTTNIPTIETVVEIKPPAGNKTEAVPSTDLSLTTAEIARAAELIDLGATRPRIVPLEKIREEAVDSNECRLVFSQERVSVFKNGGSFGIVVGLKNYRDAYVMRARSESPENILITYEPDIGSVDGRAFFVIKSISENTGEFKVTFESPCGTEAVMVDVR